VGPRGSLPVAKATVHATAMTAAPNHRIARSVFQVSTTLRRSRRRAVILSIRGRIVMAVVDDDAIEDDAPRAIRLGAKLEKYRVEEGPGESERDGCGGALDALLTERAASEHRAERNPQRRRLAHE